MNTNQILTLTLSLATLILGIVVFFVTYSQLKIASSKIKLDLYNKRFHIYESVLALYQEVYFWDKDKIRPLELELIKCLRESKFLFEKEDGIYDTILLIKDANAKNSGYYKMKEEEILGSKDEALLILHKNAVQARLDFETHLMTLEDKLDKYLNFKSINGWSFRNKRSH